jgi:hypothetical protein
MGKPFHPSPLPRQSRNRSGILKLGSWNVRTMCPGVACCDLMDTEIRKTAQIDRELNSLNVDMAVLQETQPSENGTLTEKNYVFSGRATVQINQECME